MDFVLLMILIYKKRLIINSGRFGPNRQESYGALEHRFI
jgi:hypothetical protein